jgi:excisionase family DNA binding protein
VNPTTLEPRQAAHSTKRFYRVAEVAGLLGLSESTVFRAIRAGEFPAIKVRGTYVVPAKAIDAMESSALATGLVDSATYDAQGVA